MSFLPLDDTWVVLIILKQLQHEPPQAATFWTRRKQIKNSQVKINREDVLCNVIPNTQYEKSAAQLFQGDRNDIYLTITLAWLSASFGLWSQRLVRRGLQQLSDFGVHR